MSGGAPQIKFVHVTLTFRAALARTTAIDRARLRIHLRRSLARTRGRVKQRRRASFRAASISDDRARHDANVGVFLQEKKKEKKECIGDRRISLI